MRAAAWLGAWRRPPAALRLPGATVRQPGGKAILPPRELAFLQEAARESNGARKMEGGRLQKPSRRRQLGFTTCSGAGRSSPVVSVISAALGAV